MPVMDGFEATKMIREYREFDEIPIVALSANVMSEDINEALESGMQGYIEKPINVEHFYAKLLDFLGDEATKERLKEEAKKELESMARSQSNQEDATKELEISEGLERCGGDEGLYRELLEGFVEMYADATSKLERIVHDQHYKQGKDFAHDIKGVSANIGASKFSLFVANLEDAFKQESRSNYPLLVKNFQEHIKRLLREIEEYLKVH